MGKPSVGIRKFILCVRSFSSTEITDSLWQKQILLFFSFSPKHICYNKAQSLCDLDHAESKWQFLVQSVSFTVCGHSSSCQSCCRFLSMVWSKNVFVPFQGLVTIANMSTDLSQQQDPAQKSFCKNVMWENHDLGSVGKNVPVPNLNLSFLSFEVCVCVCVCLCMSVWVCWAKFLLVSPKIRACHL